MKPNQHPKSQDKRFELVVKRSSCVGLIKNCQSGFMAFIRDKKLRPWAENEKMDAKV
jgi:hypothetical protein